MNDAYMFGDGQWVNTGGGVRELATGKPASFGQDSGRQSMVDTSFTGSAGRVFKVIDSVGFSSRMQFQPWDTGTDKAVSPELNVSSVLANPASPVFLAVDGDAWSNNATVAAYDWATGEQKWQKPFPSAYQSPGPLVGGFWVSDSDWTITAYDELTGDVKWHDGSTNRTDSLLVLPNAVCAIDYDGNLYVLHG